MLKVNGLKFNEIEKILLEINKEILCENLSNLDLHIDFELFNTYFTKLKHQFLIDLSQINFIEHMYI